MPEFPPCRDGETGWQSSAGTGWAGSPPPPPPPYPDRPKADRPFFFNVPVLYKRACCFSGRTVPYIYPDISDIQSPSGRCSRSARNRDAPDKSGYPKGRISITGYPATYSAKYAAVSTVVYIIETEIPVKIKSALLIKYLFRGGV